MAGGFLERLKAGLSRTAEAVANLLARPMDAQSAEQLRERLIAADFGPATAEEVADRLSLPLPPITTAKTLVPKMSPCASPPDAPPEPSATVTRRP